MNKNTLNNWWNNSWKNKRLKRWAIVAIAWASLFYVLKDKKHDPQAFVLRPGWSLTELVRDSITLENSEHKTNYKLQLDLVAQVMKDNNIEDPTKVPSGDTIIIDIDKLNDIANNRKAPTIQEKIDTTPPEITKIQTPEKTNGGYTVIKTLDDLKNSNNYLAQRLYADLEIRKKIKNYIKNWYTIKVPQQIENKNSPSLTIEQITKPDQILSNKLKGKKIILDPGHGSLDVWAIWFAQYGSIENKEMVAVYESPVVMDVTYRIGKLLRSHWCEVIFTHYYNKRPILDQKDLAPASRVFVNGQEKFQDIRCGTDHKCEWDVFKAWSKRLQKRCDISNSKKWVDLFVAIHADSYSDDKKILSIKHQPKTPYSQSLAEKIMENGFEYTYNGKTATEVEHSVKAQNIQVLRENNNTSLLVELWNMYNESQAFYLRDPERRQILAEKFVHSLIKSID